MQTTEVAFYRMICITDKPVAMNEWKTVRRKDVENVYAVKSSPEEEHIIEKSIESHASQSEKTQMSGPNTKGSRVRRHSSYEPSLDDIKEEGHDELAKEEKDLASLHLQRAIESGALKRNSEGRQFRKKLYKALPPARPRAFTC
ncbi:uncharacterized protein LOC116289763 [Actinia tenebrosa]|uniref:Uncharacterized protein LOC116289763 n=1 Tax=Actinia tenebrosa TaxID=6105 RepID=A0A6P8HIZ0_ACTTE|nr:uncharacterized protein LOC116289763 [Actinia tenebrosa]